MIETDFRAAFSLEHLGSRARELALLPDSERIDRIRADRWIGYAKAMEGIAKLERLFSFPKKERMPNLLVVGPTNNGKTMIIEKFKRNHSATRLPESTMESIPVASVQMPSDPTIARFYAMLLYSLGAPVTMKCKVADLEYVALTVLKKTGVRMLIIDELHNILAGRSNVQREFLNLIRFLGNELKIPIVCVGTREAYLAIRTDDQLENRFEPHILPLWEDDRELAALLASFGTSFPLRRPSHLLDDQTRCYILRRSEGTIGEIVTLLARAAILAVECGQEFINLSLLHRVDYESPTERRKRFERELR